MATLREENAKLRLIGNVSASVSASQVAVSMCMFNVCMYICMFWNEYNCFFFPLQACDLEGQLRSSTWKVFNATHTLHNYAILLYITYIPSYIHTYSFSNCRRSMTTCYPRQTPKLTHSDSSRLKTMLENRKT